MAVNSIFGNPPEQIRLNYTAHAGQEDISEELVKNFSSKEPASVIEIIASRGWGKTLYLSSDVLVPYLETHPNAKVMWVAPNYQTALSPIEDVFRGVNEVTGERWIPDYDSKGNRIWEFSSTITGPVLKWYNGASVTFKSADAPESIVSRGYNLIIIDEAALIQERVFLQQIMGTARKAGIKIFIITTPRGKKHWTYKYYLKGQDPKEKEYLSFRQPWTKNPFFSPVLAKLMKDLPDWLYRQEYLAEFVEDGDTIFKGLSEIIVGPEIEFHTNHQEWAAPIVDIKIKTPTGEIFRKAHERRFIVAMDIAQAVDYTVIYAMDIDSGDCVYYKRMNKTDYNTVISDAVHACHVYNNAELIFDATGVGAGIADFLNNFDVVAHPYIFTNASKVELINKLSLAISYKEITVPNIQTIINELSAYTYTLTKTGKVSYNAPPGFHDDTVIAIALANLYRKENNGSDEVSSIDMAIEINNSGKRRKTFWDFMEEDND